MRSVKGIFLVGLLLAIGLVYSLPGNVPTVAADTDVNVAGCGTTFSTPGEQLFLSADLSCAGTALTITADNVHLDMNGFTIAGNFTGSGIHVIGPTNNLPCGAQSGPSGFHINGGTIKKFDHGIFLCRSDTAHINGMTVKYNDLSGIFISRASTGGNSGPSDHKINGSTLSFNGCRTLIEVEDEAGYFVEEPACLDPFSEGGLIVLSAFGNTIHTMNIHDNDRAGVLFKFAAFNKITSSEIHDNVGGAVGVDRGGANIIQGNNITGNGAGIGTTAGGGGSIIRGNTLDDNNFGINLNSNNNVVRGNTVTNGAFGIFVFGAKFGNLIQSNTALGNTNRDLTDLNCPNNTWKNNTFLTFNGACIQ